MMFHIDDERLFELALDERAQLSAEEESHLDACPTCSARLVEERRFTMSIEAIPQVEIPVGFATRAVAMFEEARAKRFHLAPSLVFGLVAAALLTSFMLWMMIAHPSVFVSQMAMAVAKTVAFVKAMILVLSRVPYGSEITTTFSGAIVLISAALLAGLLKRAEQVK